MQSTGSKIDISENSLRNRGQVLDILLLDMTRSRKNKPFNIIWATDSYKKLGKDYGPTKQIERNQITGLNGKLIQPRAAKPKEEQIARTKGKAEVFTPLEIVKQMNTAVDIQSKNWPIDQHNWINYIKENRLEITCGEGPFITGRYNPTSNTGIVIETHRRVGFFDRKLQQVSKYANTKEDWLKYAEVALKATYGYEWQGDNLLIARENVLSTIDDFYKAFCAKKLNLKTKEGLNNQQLEYFAHIISWNIWQMDGIKMVIPMTCKNSSKVIKAGAPLFNEPDEIETIACEGCRTKNHQKHTGRYAKIMDWEESKAVEFRSLI